MSIQVEILPQPSGVIFVIAPFSEDNNKVWRSLTGRFVSITRKNGKIQGGWQLPDNDTVRAKLAELFGAKSEEVEALVPAQACEDNYTSQVQIGGYVLASRRGRDSEVKLPNGVTLERGSFKSRGGSVKYPSVGLSDQVFRLVCRRSFAEARGLEIAPAPGSTKPSIDV